MSVLTNGFLSINYNLLAKELNCTDFDLILLYVALGAINMSGHRYGSFLDAAATAAKFAVYSTYLEVGHNFRKTGLLHHIEPKRVKSIVQEIEAALDKTNHLKTLGSKDPDYLIGIPPLWKKLFPWAAGEHRTNWKSLTEQEHQQIDMLIPEYLPETKVLSEEEFLDLIRCMHEILQEEAGNKGSQETCSDGLALHIKSALLHSETVQEIKIPLVGYPLYVLAKNSYSPKGKAARTKTMVDDLVRFLQIMQKWVDGDNRALRAIETFSIYPQDLEPALAELDEYLRTWADKYHHDDGQAMVLQAGVAPFDPPNISQTIS